MNDRLFVVSIDNFLSTERKIQAGVPQGSVLSPTLYSIYISNFKLRHNYTTAIYAGDTSLIISGKVSNAITKNLGKSLSFANKYFDKWKIRINGTKTQAIIFLFNKSSKRIPSVNLTIQ